MRKTSVDIDDRLVEQVRGLLGTSSIRETIDRALREVVRTAARREEIRALAVMEGLDLADEQVMAGAWRSEPRTDSCVLSAFVLRVKAHVKKRLQQ